MGKVNKLGTWAPHQLTPDNIQQRISICNYLLSKPNRHRFLQQIVTGDEKWVLYVNHTRKRQWWDFEGIIYWELLRPNTTIDSKLYCQQLQNLKLVIQANRSERRKVRLLHDNVKPQTSKFTRQKLEELWWEVLPHPPYSPDLAPSDYHLFRSLRNHLVKKQFDDEARLKSDLENFFSSLTKKFFEDGNLDLLNDGSMS
ncbi:unnamed protein product [Rotaria magnacalcarata]